MNQFKYKGEIISTNIIDFKQRYFLLDERLVGSDQGIIAVFKDGNVEILYLDCENPCYSYSSERHELIDLKYEMSQVISEYKQGYGEEEYLKALKIILTELQVDLSLLDSIV